MDDPNARRLALAGRIASASIALGLVAWALADDSLIGGGPGFGWTQGIVLLLGLALGASSLARPAWNARALALVVSTGFALGAGELVLRHLFSDRYYRPYVADARTLYRLVPDAVREHRRAAINGGDRIVYRINSAGFRGEELEGSPRSLRLVLYGDSFVQGEFSLLSRTFAERLEHHVSERLSATVEVVNAGVAGYGPDQILRTMEDGLVALEPDLVLVAVFAGNDFGDMLRNKLYRLDADGHLRENQFTLSPALQREMVVSRREFIIKKITRDAVIALAARMHLTYAPTPTAESMAESMTPRERMELFLQQHLREYDEYVVRGDDVVRELRWDSYDADMSLMPGSEAARYKIELMDRILARIQEVADGIPVPLVLVLIPHAIDVCGHESGEVDRERYPDYEARGLTNLLESIATRHGIAYVELFGPFQELGGRELYFQGLDDHWNDRGQDVAAEIVAEYLMSTGPLGGESKRVSQRTGRDG